MRTWIAVLSLGFILSSLLQPADGKPRKRRPAQKAPVATAQTKTGIEQLMGEFKWGMSPKKVMGLLEKKVEADMAPEIKASATDPIAQDRLRKELLGKLRDLKKSYVKFAGKQTSWDVSLIDKEFAHKNDEALIPIWGKTDRRFFFFHNDKLYKIYLAFNSDMFADKTFEDFAQVMETRFGKAQRKFTSTIKGDAVMDHLAWPRAGQTLLRAIDNTGFYGSFCLVLTDAERWKQVRAGRKINSPEKNYNDPLVDSVTKDDGNINDHESDIVDRITGRSSDSPSAGEPGQAPPRHSPANDEPLPDKPRNKKVNSDNPLDGIDF